MRLQIESWIVDFRRLDPCQTQSPGVPRSKEKRTSISMLSDVVVCVMYIFSDAGQRGDSRPFKHERLCATTLIGRYRRADS